MDISSTTLKTNYITTGTQLMKAGYFLSKKLCSRFSGHFEISNIFQSYVSNNILIMDSEKNSKAYIFRSTPITKIEIIAFFV